MPVFDFRCQRCQHTQDHYVYNISERQLCYCGGEMDRVLLTAPTMIPDSIPGGQVIENLTATPRRFYSRTEIKDQMRVLGVESKVQHLGNAEGGDRCKQTQRWI